jgi:hypothetical protein
MLKHVKTHKNTLKYIIIKLFLLNNTVILMQINIMVKVQ